jgi:hypothetical protein
MAPWVIVGERAAEICGQHTRLGTPTSLSGGISRALKPNNTDNQPAFAVSEKAGLVASDCGKSLTNYRLSRRYINQFNRMRETSRF